MWKLREASKDAEILWRTLDGGWTSAGQYWQDVERDKFSNQHWKPLEEALYRYQEELKILSETLEQIERQIP